MSSGADELSGYDPSTPYQLARKRKAPVSRPVPGPSNAKVPRTTKSRKQKSTRESPVVVEDDDNDDDDVPEVVQPATRNDTTAKVPPSVATNGKPASKAKGKGKATPSTNGHRNDTELVIIDELDDDGPLPAKPLPSAKKGKVSAGSTDSTEKGGSFQELEKLREERDMYKEKSEQLSKSLLQLIQTRKTEPEEQLVSRKAHYDATNRAQEELIQELTTQVSRLTPMLKKGRTSTLHFLTSEAADEEKRIFEEHLREVQEELKRKDGVIKDKDTRIAALNEQLETTQADLKAEIAHTQTLQKNPKAQREHPGPAMRARTSLINDPKHGATIRLYEDLTNLIMYILAREFCLSFTLTSMYQPKPSPDPNFHSPPVNSKDDLQKMVQYTPLELEKESPEHIQKLDFLADKFTFAYDQMDYFLKTLNDHFTASEEQDD
ncbi:hypothetical protein EDB92DRAFT_1938880 [Lactarius akahatsu]|uniref:Monopolin complex subunit Csm1/Pcs1 C-terminal domain-containing protein n=1 Tax=Lactarius akahatsu TaxID=416441 RepID=A0AAD4LSP6_9AGAM|nr:hypothetical protein EDB92DRAFT_1938880 [Lactarius akahatsu]